MSSLSSLLKKLDKLTCERAAIEIALGEVRRQILASGRRPGKRRKKSSHRIDPRGVPETMSALLAALKGGPLGPGELGAKLEISRGAATKRLEVAVDKKFVERVGYGRYDLTDAARTVLA